MRFLGKVASRCGGCAFNITNYHLSIGNKCFDALRENGMIKEGEWLRLGHYFPEWSFIFDDSFIDEVALPITADVKRQVKNK